MAIPFVSARAAHAGVVGFSSADMLPESAACRHLPDLVWRAVPETASKWRVIPAAAACVLLATGAAVSRLGRVFLLASSPQRPAARRLEVCCAGDAVIRIPISRGD